MNTNTNTNTNKDTNLNPNLNLNNPIILGEILINIFGNWVNTPYEHLLEDGGFIIDYLNNSSYEYIGIPIDNYDFNTIDTKIWVEAWDIFDKMVTE